VARQQHVLSVVPAMPAQWRSSGTRSSSSFLVQQQQQRHSLSTCAHCTLPLRTGN
jgi:hypothetical protein